MHLLYFRPERVFALRCSLLPGFSGSGSGPPRRRLQTVLDSGPRIDSSNRFVPKTINRVIVYHAHRLHECITDRRTDEFEAAAQEITAQHV
jgi:hypothetical protein